MKLRLLSILFTSSMSLASCHKATMEAEHPARAPQPLTEHHAHWSYEGEDGPESWARLDQSYQLCAQGKSQSPIDIRAASHNEKLGALSFSYQASPLSMVNNGHTVQLNYQPGSWLRVQGKEYELLQLHFHDPSEHTIAGDSYPMELHLVHKSKAGELAVVGVMLQEGDESEPLASFWDALPKTPGEVESEALLDANELLPEDTHDLTYQGSLTTPSCSEGVRWILLKEPISISSEQLDAFANTIGRNARPTQPLNARLVEEY